jgi:P-type Cu+ transporter
MKMFLVILAAAFLLTAGARAQDAHKATDTKNATTQKLVCPVTGEDADPDVSYAYKGTTYYFCCEGCVKKFKKDPEKYIAASAKRAYDACNDHGEKHAASDAQTQPAADDGKAVINEGKDMSAQISNSVCPVMNKKVDKEVTTVTYRGKVYGFCCKSCIKKFAANPDKYLKQDQGS